MADAKTTICNMALTHIGDGLVLNLDEDNERARLCKAFFDTLRDEVLEAADWNFAITRVEIQQTVNTPLYEYDYEYQLPADCIRVVEMQKTNHAQPKWVREGDKILTNEDADVYIRIIQRITDTAKYPPSFKKALSYHIAEFLCRRLGKSDKLKAELAVLYDDALSDANLYDAREGNPDREEADTPLQSEGR